MRVLLINTCYPNGSTGKIVKAIEEYYNQHGHMTYIIYGQGEKTNGQHYKLSNKFFIKIQSVNRRITGVMYGGCIIPTFLVKTKIKNIKPDIVHIHCINSNFVNIYSLITWLKNNSYLTVLTNHAEFMYTANCGYALDCEKYQSGCGECPRLKRETNTWFVDSTHKSWKRMKDAFSGFHSLVVTNVSPWLNERASASAMLKDYSHRIILNGLDDSVFTYKKKCKDTSKKIVLHVTSFFSDDTNDRKGGSFLIEIANKFVENDVVIWVAGNHSPGIKIPSNMKLLGNISNQEQLACIYSSADVVLLTSKKETFSMVVAESLCCGTPVVGFMAGAPEQIAIPEYSEFVPYGDIEALYKATVNMLNRCIDKTVLSDIAKLKYSKEKMAEDYLKLYRECL